MSVLGHFEVKRDNVIIKFWSTKSLYYIIQM